jgi:16S rRNA (cytosine967-C5)-methyltransferase
MSKPPAGRSPGGRHGRTDGTNRRGFRQSRGRGEDARGRADRPPRGGPNEPAGTGRPGARGAAVDEPRLAAYEAVAAVHRDDAYANLVLPRILRDRRLGGRDAAFATELTYGTLRLTGTLDAVVAAAAGRDVARIDPPVRDALRLGAYQLLRMRVPAHAATATTVDLVRMLLPGAVGFANAVLRQIGERDFEGWLARLAPAYTDDPVAHLALVHAHPQWIVRAYSDALAGDLDEVGRALAADNEPAPVHLCARPGRVRAADLAAEVGGTPGAFGEYAVYLTAGAPGDLASLSDGRAHVQDEGSQLVTAAVADADCGAGPDERWLDLCAGPGGKAGLLGSLAALRGARLTAVDVTAHRADMVARATRGLPVQVICADGRDVGRHEALPVDAFDRVLVDAPCTGLGALRRRPEARWRRQPGDLPPLTRLQRELLLAALRAVRPGGLVGYVTCSPHLVETQVSVTEASRRSGLTVDLVEAGPLLPAGMPGLGTGPTVQLWPHRHGTDGMYLALLRRR